MNICFITSEYEDYTKTGGIASALNSLIPELIKLGHRITVVTRSDNNRTIIKQPLLTIYPVVSKGIWATLHFPFLVAKILPRLIKQESIDIIETTLTKFPSLISAHVTKNTPLVLRIYTSLSTLLGGKSLKKKLNRAIHYRGELHNLFKADALSIATQASFNKIIKHYKLSRENISIPTYLIPIGMSVTEKHMEKNQARQKLLERLGGTLLSNKFLITYIGAIHQHKGVDLIIEAAKWFNRNNSRVHFVLIGRGDITKFTDTDGLPTNCTYLGPVTEVEKNIFLRGSDTILIPSRWESFGIVSLEAMNQKIPLIAGDAGGLKEIVQDEKTGWLVNHTKEDLIDKINIVINMPSEKINAITEEAWRYFKSKFDIKNTAKQHISFYKEVIRSSKKHGSIQKI